MISGLLRSDLPWSLSTEKLGPSACEQYAPQINPHNITDFSYAAKMCKLQMCSISGTTIPGFPPWYKLNCTPLRSCRPGPRGWGSHQSPR